MTPDRITGWIRKRPTGGDRIQLAVPTAAGVEGLGTWERDEEPDDVCAALIAQAQEHCDAEGDGPIKFQVRWLGEADRVVKKITHIVKPTPREDEAEKQISDATIIRELLSALDAKDKRIEQMLEASGKATDRTIRILTERMEDFAKELKRDAQRRAREDEHAGTALVLSDEQREESLQRAHAMKALTGVIPELGEALIAVLAQRFLPPVPGAEGDTPPDAPGAGTQARGNGTGGKVTPITQ